MATNEKVEIFNITAVTTYEKDGKEQKAFDKIGEVVLYRAPKGKARGAIKLFMHPNQSYPIFTKEEAKEGEAKKGEGKKGEAKEAEAA